METDTITDLREARQRRHDELIAEYRQLVESMATGRSVEIEDVDGLLKDLDLADTELARDVETVQERHEIEAASLDFIVHQSELEQELEQRRKAKAAAYAAMKCADRTQVEALLEYHKAGRPISSERSRQERLEVMVKECPRLFGSLGGEESA